VNCYIRKVRLLFIRLSIRDLMRLLLPVPVNIYPKDELLGLIYFISSDESNTLPDMLDIDRTLKPIDLGMISDKKGMSAHEWRTRMARLEDAAPLVVFSKVSRPVLCKSEIHSSNQRNPGNRLIASKMSLHLNTYAFPN
jgi:hypothetical protein